MLFVLDDEHVLRHDVTHSRGFAPRTPLHALSRCSFASTFDCPIRHSAGRPPSACYACAPGSRSVNVLPRPWPALSAKARPPCLRATDRPLKSPTPLTLGR